MKLVLDIGNSRIKWGLWDGSSLTEVHDYDGTPDSLPTRLPVAYAAVGSCPADLSSWLQARQATALDGLSPGLLHSLYQSPHTLGADRWCAIHAAWLRADRRACLVLDVGTAVTTDLADNQGRYLGGSISPGLHLRYQSLHTYTHRLPLLQPVEPWPALGTDTRTAIQQGVQQGLLYELEGHMAQARAQFPQLSVFLTGGQAQLFAKPLESRNFAPLQLCPSLVLEGVGILSAL